MQSELSKLWVFSFNQLATFFLAKSAYSRRSFVSYSTLVRLVYAVNISQVFGNRRGKRPCTCPLFRLLSLQSHFPIALKTRHYCHSPGTRRPTCPLFPIVESNSWFVWRAESSSITRQKVNFSLPVVCSPHPMRRPTRLYRYSLDFRKTRQYRETMKVLDWSIRIRLLTNWPSSTAITWNASHTCFIFKSLVADMTVILLVILKHENTIQEFFRSSN